ncbi:MAG TPA: AI-2E family transporter [Chloroflexaceae bacterium]|nr:AI-2E family transporter [Chloroflexaceae bacterium]
MALKLTPRTWLALVALGLAIYLAIQALPLLRPVFLLLLVTAFLALLITPLADAMERRGVSRGLTTGAAVFGALALLAGLLLMLLPVLFDSLSLLAGAIDGLAARLPAELSAATGLRELGDLSGMVTGQVAEAIRWAAGQAGGLLGQIGLLAFAAFVSFAIIFALVGDRRAAPGLMNLLLPKRHHARAARLARAVSEGLSRWFVAQLAICTYYAATYTATLLVLGVPYAVQIGVVSGLLEFIPYLGGIVGLTLSVLAAATVSPTTVVMVVVIETVIGMLAVYVVVPYVFARAIDVPPALILFGLFIGGLVGGFFAALLTVPALAVLMVVLRELRPDLWPAEPEPAPAQGAVGGPVGD